MASGDCLQWAVTVSTARGDDKWQLPAGVGGSISSGQPWGGMCPCYALPMPRGESKCLILRPKHNCLLTKARKLAEKYNFSFSGNFQLSPRVLFFPPFFCVACNLSCQEVWILSQSIKYQSPPCSKRPSGDYGTRRRFARAWDCRALRAPPAEGRGAGTYVPPQQPPKPALLLEALCRPAHGWAPRCEPAREGGERRLVAGATGPGIMRGRAGRGPGSPRRFVPPQVVPDAGGRIRARPPRTK